MDALQAAKYVLSHPMSKDYDISPLKLQKLVYYIKVWCLVDNKPNVINANFNKWTYGPVNKDIYHTYKQFKNLPIPKEIISSSSSDILSIEERNTIDFVLENYLPIDAIALSLMTHKEIPWVKTDSDCIIGDNLIISYYSKLPFARNFPLNSTNIYYPLLTNSNYAFFADMGKREMDILFPYESYDYYKTLKEENKIDTNLLDMISNIEQ